MKKQLLFIIVFIPLALFSQPNTEIYLFDLEASTDHISLTNGKNVSNNDGYDNQPSFMYINTLVFSSTRNGQTDIVSYSLNDGSKKWLSDTKQGSEYSPMRIPNSKDVSAVRLDTTGLQRLYHYRSGKYTELLKDKVVGYYVWNSNNSIVSFVLGEPHELVVSDLKKNTHTTVDTNIGRSLHNIPNTNLVSYISKKNKDWEIRSLNPKTGETNKIVLTVPNVEDMCWLNDGSILMAKGRALYRLHPQKDSSWKIIKLFDKEKFTNITRVAVNQSNTKLVIAAMPEKVQKPTLANVQWIAGSWQGEAFGGIAEEIWSKPSGNSMMGVFKLLVGDTVQFYEAFILTQEKDSLLLRLKHFNGKLEGWEEKNESVEFPLIKVTENEAIFEGLTMHLVDEKNMTVYVKISEKDGKSQIIPFYYSKM